MTKLQRARMHNPPTRKEEQKERRLLRAYRREVENGQ